MIRPIYIRNNTDENQTWIQEFLAHDIFLIPTDGETLSNYQNNSALLTAIGKGEASIGFSPTDFYEFVNDQINYLKADQGFNEQTFPEKVIDANNRVRMSIAPDPHHTTHENGGGDEINVEDLSGVLADQQHIIPSEAVSAMGVKANNNPLNHDKFQQSDISNLPESQLQLNYATHSNANDPTTSEKQGLDAASSPGTANPFLTKSAGDAAYAALAHDHPSTQITDFVEAAQDAVGGALVNTNSIAWDYNDANNQIKASVRKKNSTSVDMSEGVDGIQADLNATLKSNYDAAHTHVGRTDNPHSTTKSQVGLGNCDNTSDLLKPISNATQSALDNKLNTSLKGAVNGLAELGSDGLVPSSQLPAYVDDVIEVANYAALPNPGSAGKIYVTLNDNKTYRWGGSAYVEISASLALGETSSTAYRGDRGKIAYDHSQIVTGNPHGTTKSDLGLGNVTNDAQLKIASNLSDLNNVVTARTNLGLGNSATRNVGTGSGDVAAGDHGHTWSQVSKTGSKLTDIADVPAYPNNGLKNVLRELNNSTAWQSIDSLLSEQGDPIVCQARRTTSQTVGTSYADITLDSTDVESDNTVIDHNDTTRSRIDIKQTGYYLLYYSVKYGDNASGASSRLAKNGSTLITGTEDTSGNSCWGSSSRTVLAHLTAGEWFTLQSKIASGATTIRADATVIVLRFKGSKGDKGDAGGSTVDVLQDNVSVKADIDQLNFVGAVVTDAGGNKVTVTISPQTPKRTIELQLVRSGNFSNDHMNLASAGTSINSQYTPPFNCKVREVVITGSTNGSGSQVASLEFKSIPIGDDSTPVAEKTISSNGTNVLYNEQYARYWGYDLTSENYSLLRSRRYSFRYYRASGSNNLSNIHIHLILDEV